MFRALAAVTVAASAATRRVLSFMVGRGCRGFRDCGFGGSGGYDWMVVGASEGLNVQF
jgi:hypothetical protein